MNIHEILTTIPHNIHHLNRYCKFIQNCYNNNKKLNKKTSYLENHHICPKSLFAEYGSFKENKWNKVKLTGRQHLIAHRMLSKIYPNSNMCYAYLRMMNSTITRDNFKITSREYEQIKILCAEKTSVRTTEWIKNNGHRKGMLGKKHTEEFKESVRKRLAISHPKGMLGKHHSKEQCEKWSKERKGENSPNYGKKLSDEMKAKISENNKGLVIVKEIDSDNIIKVTSEEYKLFKDIKYISVCKGNKYESNQKDIIAAIDLTTGQYVRITKEEFYSLKDVRYVGVRKGIKMKLSPNTKRMKDKEKLDNDIIELYKTRPLLIEKCNYKTKSGKFITYQSVFSKQFASDFNKTPQYLRKVVDDYEKSNTQ